MFFFFLSHVRSLSDIDHDGKLSCDEYVLAMHLADMSRGGQPLPAKLPPDLVPPKYRQAAGITSLPGQAIGMPPGQPPPPSTGKSCVEKNRNDLCCH